RSADADEHLHELGAADRKERDARLAGDRPREQRLPRARRTDEQHALRDFRTETRELLRCAQEIDDLDQLGLRLVRTCDIRKRDPRALLAHDARTVAA